MSSLSSLLRRQAHAVLQKQGQTAIAINKQCQTRPMSKFLPKSAAKRLPLTTKRARKGFYKGKGGTTQGTHTGRAGAYLLDKDRMLELEVPDLEGFKVCRV